MKQFNNVLQPHLEEVFNKDYSLKGRWRNEVFGNSNAITLELGCGKGEYTVGLAKKNPGCNYIGIDIKGSRIWKGAKEAHELGLKNVFFVRTRIEFINSFFDKDEVSEIWFTFPDPQLKKPRKRLTSSRFLNSYSQFLRPGGTLHLKTDNEVLYLYTERIARFNGLTILRQTNDLYKSEILDEVLNLKTYYEEGFLKKGLRSHYIQFTIDSDGKFDEPPDEE